MGYDYQIIYRLGTHNQVVDALSILPEQESFLLMTFFVSCLTFIDELRKQLENWHAYVNHWQAIMQSPASHPESTIAHNLILEKGRI